LGVAIFLKNKKLNLVKTEKFIKFIFMEEALEILEEIRENVCICCAVTMEPDEVEVLIDKLKMTIEKGWNKQ